jgi:hypothetical protein
VPAALCYLILSLAFRHICTPCGLTLRLLRLSVCSAYSEKACGALFHVATA